MLFSFGVTSPFHASSKYTMSVWKFKVAFWEKTSNIKIKYLGNLGVSLFQNAEERHIFNIPSLFFSPPAESISQVQFKFTSNFSPSPALKEPSNLVVDLLLNNHPSILLLKHPATLGGGYAAGSLPWYLLIPSPLLLSPALAVNPRSAFRSEDNTERLTFPSFRVLFTASQKRWWNGPLKVTYQTSTRHQTTAHSRPTQQWFHFKKGLKISKHFTTSLSNLSQCCTCSWTNFSDIQPAPSPQHLAAVIILSSIQSGLNYLSLT